MLRWTMQLLEEFFRQGDKERELGLPFSPLCDRNNTLVAESQIGFIEFIVEPSMQVCSDMLETVLAPLNVKETSGDEPSNGKKNCLTNFLFIPQWIQCCNVLSRTQARLERIGGAKSANPGSRASRRTKGSGRNKPFEVRYYAIIFFNHSSMEDF